MIRSKYQKAKFAARAAGETFFVGHVCKRHPELKGQRRAKSGGCPQCIRDRMALPKNRKATRARTKRRREAIKVGTHVPREAKGAQHVTD